MNIRLRITASIPAFALSLTALFAGAGEIQTAGPWLKDKEGRTIILRGTNVGGSSKVPAHPDQVSRSTADFFEYRNVSFVGRPFPIDEADEHFARLSTWGLTLIRLVVPWEAIEHAGPGIYDKEYLLYLRDLIAKADKYGLKVLIDPHQDVWSRWTGGSGAPGWTLEAAGIDLRQLYPTGAALTYQLHQGAYRNTSWVSNYNRYGAATMFTLFFGGNDFAPQLKVGATSIQDFLQSHFLDSFRQVALTVKGLPNVVGFGTLNEPGRGYIGLGDLTQVASSMLLVGPGPTPFQGMLAASGYPQEVTVMGDRGGVEGKTVLNPTKARLQSDGAVEIWKQHGVWADKAGEPKLLKPRYFSDVRGRPVDFVGDYLVPFIDRYRATIRSVLPDTLIFVEPVAAGKDIQVTMPATKTAGMVYAPKWYDGPTMVSKTFYSWMDDAGRQGVMHNFIAGLAGIKASAARQMPGMPLLISEFGMPMNLEGGRAFKTGDYSVHEEAFNSYFAAMESNLLNAVIWNYTSDNTHARGDQWNTEDFSIFSRDDKQNGGGRALSGIVRPYAARTAGEPLRMRFDHRSKIFEYEFRPDQGITAPTEIFVPELQYPHAYRVTIEGGDYEEDKAQQLLRIKAKPGAALVRIGIHPKNHYAHYVNARRIGVSQDISPDRPET